MIAKRLLALSLVLPFLAIPGVASAGHNYQHRPIDPRATEAKTPQVPMKDCDMRDSTARPGTTPAPSDKRYQRLPER